jgi:hypothetical protein
MMGLVWCHRMVISYISLSICLSILSSLFNPHLGLSFSFVCRHRMLTTKRRGHRTSSVRWTLSRTRMSGGRCTQRRLSRPANH